MLSLHSRYPKASEARLEPFEPAMVKIRRNFLLAIGKNFLILQVLFLILFCWVFGVLYQQTSHTHNLTVLFVDYDGGAIGEAFRAAYSNLQADSFPTLVERSPLEPDVTGPSNLRDAVCRVDYWASLYIAPGASDRLHAALTGASPAALYNKTDVVTYVWNQARYATVADGAIASNMLALSSAAKIAYATVNATGASINATDPGVFNILVDLWQLSSVNIQPTSQGSRAIYNTLVIVLILLQEFFYLGTLNAIYGQLKLWTKAKPYLIVPIRFANSALYTFVGALCSTGAIWAFRSGWDVDGGQFALNWMVLWLFAHVNFQVLDVFSIYVPAPYLPLCLISWVMVNVASVLLPFELSPAFFKIGYMFPSRAVFQVLIDIWSRGCNPLLESSLTVLFAWELVASVLSGIGVYRRCHYAKLAEEHDEEVFMERVSAAVAFEKKRVEEALEKARQRRPSTLGDGGQIRSESSREDADEADEAVMKHELESVISRVDERIKRENMKRRASAAATFGPTFSLPFECGEDD